MAGEFLTLGKLFKRGLQASVTFGNAKAVDVLVYNPDTDKNYSVQVKTVREKNCFPIKKSDIHRDHIYVFVILGKFTAEEQFYIIKGGDILDDVDTFFGGSYRNGKVSNVPTVNYGPLKKYQDNWMLFDK
jgi:hypothetical protein